MSSKTALMRIAIRTIAHLFVFFFEIMKTMDHHSRALCVKHAPVGLQAQKRILLHSAQRECGAAEFREGKGFPPGGGMHLVDGAGGVVS